MLIKNGCRGKSCYFVGCTRMDCEEGWKEAMDPRGGINQQQWRKMETSRWSEEEKEKQLGTGHSLGSVAMGFACILDNAEKLGKGRNVSGRNMTVITLFYIASGQGVIKSLPQHLCRSCCFQPSPN